MSVVALIGARSGSVGVPNKNIRMLGGHPLIAWSIAAAQRAASIDRIFVCTDSAPCARIASDYGAEVIMLPGGVTKDTSTDADWIGYVLTQLKPLPERIVHLRPTSPLRNFNVIDSAALAFIPSHDSLRSVEQMSESAFKAMTVVGGRLGTINGASLDDVNAPRQSFPETWRPNGYVDVLKTAFILKNKRLHGANVQAFATQPTIEVDTEEDFERLEYQLGKRHYDPPVLARTPERAAG